MKKSIFSAVIAVIILAGCAPRENEANFSSSSSQTQNSVENSTFTSKNSENSNSNLTNDFSSSSSYNNSSYISSDNNNFKPDSASSGELSSSSIENSSNKPEQSTPVQSSLQSTPVQSSSSTPTQSSSQKPASSSSKQTESKPAQSSNGGNANIPGVNPAPGGEQAGNTSNLTPTDTTGMILDENGFPTENLKRGTLFVDKDHRQWAYNPRVGWEEVTPGSGGQLPGPTGDPNDPSLWGQSPNAH